MDGRFPKWQLQHVVAAVVLTATVAFIVTATWRRRSRARSAEKLHNCSADDTSQPADGNTAVDSKSVARDSGSQDSKPTCKLKNTLPDAKILNVNTEISEELYLGASKNKYSVLQQGKPSLSSPRERHTEKAESISTGEENLSFTLKNFKISPILELCLREFENRPMDTTRLIDQPVSHFKPLAFLNQAIKLPDDGKVLGRNKSVRFSLTNDESSIYQLPEPAKRKPSAIKETVGKNERDDFHGDTHTYGTVEMDSSQGENDWKNLAGSEHYCSQQASDLNERQKFRGNSETLRELYLSTEDSDFDEQCQTSGELRANISPQATDSFILKPVEACATMCATKHEIFCKGIEKYASQISNSRFLTSIFQNFGDPKTHEFLSDASQETCESLQNDISTPKASGFESYHKFRYEDKDTQNEVNLSHHEDSSPKNEVGILEDSLKDEDRLTETSLNSGTSILFVEDMKSSSIPTGSMLPKVSMLCPSESSIYSDNSETCCNVNNSVMDVSKTLHQQSPGICKTYQTLVPERGDISLNALESLEATHDTALRDPEVSEDLDVKYRVLKTQHKCSVLLSKYLDDTFLNIRTSNGTSFEFGNLYFCERFDRDDPPYLSRSVDDLNSHRFRSAKNFQSQWTFPLKNNKKRKSYSCASLFEISSCRAGQMFHITPRKDKIPEPPFLLDQENADSDKNSYFSFQETFTPVKGIALKTNEESFNKTNTKHHALINRERKDSTLENSQHCFLNATEPSQNSPHYTQQRANIYYNSENYMPREENWNLNNSLASQTDLNLQITKFLSSSEENLSETASEYLSLSNENLSEESKQYFFSCSEDLSQENELSLSDGNLSQESSEYFSLSEENLVKCSQQSSIFEGYGSDKNFRKESEDNITEQKIIIPEENENRSNQECAESFLLLKDNSGQREAQLNQKYENIFQFSTNSSQPDCSSNERPSEPKNIKISSNSEAGEQQSQGCLQIQAINYCDAGINGDSKHPTFATCPSKAVPNTVILCTEKKISKEHRNVITNCINNQPDENAKQQNDLSFKWEPFVQSLDFSSQILGKESEKCPAVSQAADDNYCSNYTVVDLGQTRGKSDSQSAPLNAIPPGNRKFNNEREQCAAALLGASTVTKTNEENEKCTTEYHFETNCLETRNSVNKTHHRSQGTPISVSVVSSEDIQVNSGGFTQKSTLDGQGGGHEIVNESLLAFNPLCVHAVKHTLTWGEEGGGGVPERDFTKPRGQRSRTVNGGPPEVNNRREFPSDVISCASLPEEKSAADHASIGGGQGSAADEIWNGGRNLQLQIVTNSPVPLRQQMVIGDDHCRNSSCTAHEPTLARGVGISAPTSPTQIGATRHVRCGSGHPEKLDADGQQLTSCGVHHHSVSCRPESLTAGCSIESDDSSEQRHTVLVASQSPLTSCLNYFSVHRTEAAPVTNTTSTTETYRCSLNCSSKGDSRATEKDVFQNCSANSGKELNLRNCERSRLKEDQKATPFFESREIYQPVESINTSHLQRSENELIHGAVTNQKEEYLLSQYSSDVSNTVLLPAADEKIVTWNADCSARSVPQQSNFSALLNSRASTVSLQPHGKFCKDYPPFHREQQRGKSDFCSVNNAKWTNVESTHNCHQFSNEVENNSSTEHLDNSLIPGESDSLSAKKNLNSKLIKSSLSQENLNKKVEIIIDKIKESLEISVSKLKSDYFSVSKEFEFCFENYITCLKNDFQLINQKLKENYDFSVDNARDFYCQHADKINNEIKVVISELEEHCEVRAAELTNNYGISVIQNFRLAVDKLHGVKNSLEEIKAIFDLFVQELKNSKPASDTFTDNFYAFVVRTGVQLGKSSEKLQEDIEILSALLNERFEFKAKSNNKSDLVVGKLIFKKSKGSAGEKIKIRKNTGLKRKKNCIFELKSRRHYILLKSKCRIKNFGALLANRLKIMEESSRISNPRLLGLIDRNRERQARLHYLAEIAQDGTPMAEENKDEKICDPTANHGESSKSYDVKGDNWNFQIPQETNVKNQRSATSDEEFLVIGADKPSDSVTEQVDTEELYNSNLKAISEAIEHMQDLIKKDQTKRESISLDEAKDHGKQSEGGTSSSEDWDALMRDVLSHVSSLEEWMKSEGGAAKERTLGLGPNLREVTKASAGWREASARRSPEEFAETSAVVTKESRSTCDARSFRGSEMDVCEVEPSSPEVLQVSDSPLKPPTKVKNLRFKLDPDVYDFPSENGHDEDAAPHHRSKSSRHVWFAPQQPKYQAFSSLDLGRNTEPVKVVSVRTSVVPAGQKMVVKPVGFTTGGQRSSDEIKDFDLPRPHSAEPQIKVRQLDIDLRIRLETENGIESECKDLVNGNRRPSPDSQTKRIYLSTSPSQAKRKSPVYEHSKRVDSSPERIDWRDVWTSVSIETNESVNGDSSSNNPFKEMCDLTEDHSSVEQGDRTGLNSPSMVSKFSHAEQDQKSDDTDCRISPARSVNDENLSDSTTSSRPDITPVKTPRKHLYVPKKKKFVPDPEAIERITGYKTAVSVLKPPLPPLPAAPVISSSYRLISGVKSRTDSARKRYFDSKAMLAARNADGSFKFEQFLTEAQKDRSRLVTSTPDLAAIEVAVRQQWSKENKGSTSELDRELREQSPSEGMDSPDTIRRNSTLDDVWMSYVQHLRKQLNRRSRSLGYLETDLDACLAEDKVRSTLTLDQTESAPRSLTPGPSGSKFEKRDIVSFSELGRAKSEHELRIEKSLQNLSLPEWYRHSNRPKTGFLLNKKQEEKKGWAAVKSLNSSTTSLASSSGTSARPRRPVRSLRTSRENLTWSRGSASPSGVDTSYVSKSSGPSLSLALAKAFREPYIGWRARTPSSCASPSPQPDLSPPSWGGGADLTERSDTPLTSDLPTMDEETTAESLEEPFGDIDYIIENRMSPLMHSARDETCEDIKNMSLDTIEIHAPVTNGHHVASVTHDDTCDDIDNLTMDTFELFEPISNGDIKASLLTSEEDACENREETNHDTAENGDTGFQSSLMLEDTCDDIPNLSTDTSDNIPLVINVENASPVPTSKSCPGSCEKDKIVMDSSEYQPLGINGNTESHLIRPSETTDDVHIVHGKLNGTANYEKQNSEVRFRKVSKDNKNKEDIKKKRYSYNQSIYHSELHDPPHDEIRELSPAADINGSLQSLPSDSSGSSKVIWIESSFVGSRTTTSIVVLPVEDEKGKDRCYGNQENTGSNPSVGRPASR